MVKKNYAISRGALYLLGLLALLYLVTPQLDAWPIIWDNGSDERCFGVAIDPSGYVIVAGYHHPYNNVWRVAKYNSAGTFLWDRTWDFGWGSHATDVATDGSGNIYVCGSYPDPNYHDWKIIKYSPSGSVLWERDFDGGSCGGGGTAQGIATDPSGNVIVVGYYNPNGNNIWRVAKYNSSGTFLWDRTWDFGWGSDATDVATDGSGNIYVCGGYPNPNDHDWKIIVYGPGGSVISEYPGWSIGGEDRPEDIALRGSYFYAAGATNAYGNYDWVIQQYSVIGLEEQNSYDKKTQIRFVSLPNPVNDCATIIYNIPEETYVRLSVFNVNGQLVQVLVNKNQKPGNYQVNWSIRNVSEKKLPNGVYFYRLTAGDYTNSKKMTVVR